MKHLEVTAAILIENGEILCTQRKESKYEYISHKFEFPGGKTEPDESFEQALARELKEELGLDIAIQPDQFYLTIEHEYPDFSITMHCYLCQIDHRMIKLYEHKDLIWLKPEKLMTLDWAAADLPIVKQLMEAHR
jgi:8-oxo-dGTP diphosphatase